MRWSLIPLIVFLILPLPVEAQGISNYRFKTQIEQPESGRSCYQYCLSRGGLHQQCDEQCGMTEASQRARLIEEGAEDIEAAERSLQNSSEIEPIGKRVEIDHKAQMSGESRNFDGVNYNCFKTCRLQGDSYDTCSMLCSE